LIDCRKIVKASPVPLGDAYGEGNPKLVNGVWFNGVGENAHETFALGKTPIREHCNPACRGFNFCKTANKPYDLIVVACLCVLQHHLGKQVEVSSDGNEVDWKAGTAFANKVLCLKNPLEGQQ